MKRIVVAGITIFLIITICFSLFANADIHEEKNVIVKPYDKESEMLLFISKGKEIQFNVTSNRPVHVYIMTSDAHFDLNWSSPYDEDDFAINVLEKKNIEKAYFSWTKPDDQSYYLVIFNPNEENTTVSFSFTETLVEEFIEAFGGIFAGICAGTMCLVGIILYFIISVVIAYWMLKDADKRGKNGVVWFIIGLILSIIGLIIWFLIRPPIKKVTKIKPSDRRCPNCGRTIPIDARICPYCNKQFW